MVKNLEKYKGIFPAFYACYDDEGNISPERTRKLARYLQKKGVKGLYVGGSSGECIYQNIEERKLVLENVVAEVKGELTIIAHIAAPSTRDSIELAQHAESLGVDALAAIPPIYFSLPEHSVEDYWMSIVNNTNTDFIIYNIPQNTGYELSEALFAKMMEHPNVIGVKNSSMPVLDINKFKMIAPDNSIIFNGPDEQFVGGRIMGADGGIGGTYGVMPELYLAANKYIEENMLDQAREIQFDINKIIFKLLSSNGNMYDFIKLVLKENGVNIGRARGPLSLVPENEISLIHECKQMIDDAIVKYCQ